MTHRYHRTKGDPVEPTIKEMCLNNNILYLGKGDEDENDKTLYQFQCSCGFSWEDVAEVFFNMILKKENFDESYTPCPSCNEYRRKAIDPELLDEDYEESDNEESDDEQSDDEQSNDEKSDQEESGMDFCQPVVEIINLDSDSDSDSDPDQDDYPLPYINRKRKRIIVDDDDDDDDDDDESKGKRFKKL